SSILLPPSSAVEPLLNALRTTAALAPTATTFLAGPIVTPARSTGTTIRVPGTGTPTTLGTTSHPAIHQAGHGGLVTTATVAGVSRLATTTTRTIPAVTGTTATEAPSSRMITSSGTPM